MKRYCFLSLALSVPLLAILLYADSQSHARSTAALQRQINELTRIGKQERNEARQVANSLQRALKDRSETQRNELAAVEGRLVASIEMIASLQEDLADSHDDLVADVRTCRGDLKVVDRRAESRGELLDSVVADLEMRIADLSCEVSPLNDELRAIESNLAAEIDAEREARQRLARKHDSAFVAQSDMLDSYSSALRTLADARTARGIAERELVGRNKVAQVIAGTAQTPPRESRSTHEW